MKTLSQISKVKIVMLFAILLLASTSFAMSNVASATVTDTVTKVSCSAHIRDAETGVRGAEGNVYESGEGSGWYKWYLVDLTDVSVEYESKWYRFDGDKSVAQYGFWTHIAGSGHHYELSLYVVKGRCTDQDTYRFWA